MNKKRELIKEMVVLLECTDSGGLQRQADKLIGRAIELLAQRETKYIELSSQIAWLRGTNDRLEADLRLAKTALVETIRLINNQPNDSYEQAERKK